MPLGQFLDGYAHDPENFDYDAFVAAVKKEHDLDVAGASAKIDQVTAARDALANENTSLKARNWDLFQSLPADHTTRPDKVADNDGLPEGEHMATIDDLFKAPGK